MKKSEMFRFVQRCVWSHAEAKTTEEIDQVLDILAVLRKEEELALFTEKQSKTNLMKEAQDENV